MDEDMLRDEISYVLNEYVENIEDVDADLVESIYGVLKDTDIRDDENIDNIIRETYDALNF